MSIKNNTTSLQEILETINALPEAGSGVELPTLTNPATEDEIFLNKETLDADGNLKIGAFTIDSELNTQDDLITQIQGALQNKTAGKTVVDDVSKAIIDGAITEISDDSIKTLRRCVFAYCGSLTTISFPACTHIGISAFAGCHSLTTASFPVCTSIGSYAFNNCYALTTVSFPACTNIGNSAFAGCEDLRRTSFPVCTSIGSSAFNNCYYLTTASFPACTNVANGGFSYCTRLATISFPVCSTIGNYAFANCSTLTTIFFPMCKYIGSSAFYACSSLTTASFSVCRSISGSAFYGCRTLSSLTLGVASVCTLSNSNAFYSTPFAGYSTYFSGTPYIYVRASLVDAYKSATNWVYFSNYISAIEGSDMWDDGVVADITFTIDGISYQAASEMTWEEWVFSDYNTDGFSDMGDYVMTSDYYSYVRSSANVLIKLSDLIVNGEAYHTY